MLARAPQQVSVCYSLGAESKAGQRSGKGSFILNLVEMARTGTFPDLQHLSDRAAAREIKKIRGVGDWVAMQCMLHFLGRADMMVSTDLTLRNMLNDLYNISHAESETALDSAASFDDSMRNRILIDRLARANGWHGYRSLILFLCYFLQEDSLVLL